jgi:hypothetical protein
MARHIKHFWFHVLYSKSVSLLPKYRRSDYNLVLRKCKNQRNSSSSHTKKKSTGIAGCVWISDRQCTKYPWMLHRKLTYSSVFWLVTRCEVIWTRGFETTYRYHRQGSRCLRCPSWTS